MNNIRFILLMRHAKHTHGKPEEAEREELKDIAASMRKLAGIEAAPLARAETQADVLTKAGRSETVDVANRLKEHMEEQMADASKASDKRVLAAVFVAESPEAEATANTVMASLNLQSSMKLPFLSPSEAVKITKESAGKDASATVKDDIRRAIQQIPEGTQGNAVLFIGHEPMLGWIANALVGDAHAQMNSEILCLDYNTNDPPILRWTISPSDDKTLEDLREKVRKKMELAGALGGFIAAGIGFIIGTLADIEKAKVFQAHFGMTLLAMACLFGGVIFYLLTMFSYDSLLMPKRFWRETVAGTNNRPRWLVARPPSPAQWILYQNMLRVWFWQFMPATCFALYGLFVLGVTVVIAAAKLTPEATTRWGWLIICMPLIAAMAVTLPRTQKLMSAAKAASKRFKQCPGLAGKFQYVFGPWLGSED